MNNQAMTGQWKQTKGVLMEKWGKLTDGELDQMKGNTDQIIGRIQEKYGESKEEVAAKVNALLKKMKS